MALEQNITPVSITGIDLDDLLNNQELPDDLLATEEEPQPQTQTTSENKSQEPKQEQSTQSEIPDLEAILAGQQLPEELLASDANSDNNTTEQPITKTVIEEEPTFVTETKPEYKQEVEDEDEPTFITEVKQEPKPKPEPIENKYNHRASQYLEDFDLLSFEDYTTGLELCYSYIKEFFDPESIHEITALRPLLQQSQQDLIQELEIYKADTPKAGIQEPIIKLLHNYGFYSQRGYFLLKGRYVVPIRNASGRLISLVGWFKDIKKYVTIPTRYFDKKLDWFNIDDAMDLSLSELNGVVFIVEGIFDALSLRSIGVPAIATMGSTVEHIKGATLKLFNKVVMFADADDVGNSAVNRWSVPDDTTKVLMRLSVDLQLNETKTEKVYNSETHLYETKTTVTPIIKHKKLKDPDDLVTYTGDPQGLYQVLLSIADSKNRIEYLQ